MPAERYYLEHLPDIPATVFLEGQEFHHFLHVMRNAPGNEVELIDGKGKLAKAQVEAVSKKQASLKIIDLIQAALPAYRLILAQAMPRLNRLEFILEKGTELGMSEIWLFPSVHSEKKEFSDNQMQRLEGIIIAATKQCGRLYRPVIHLKPPLKQWKKPDLPSFYGDLSPSAPLFLQRWQPESKEVIFFIGPESGFSAEETAFLKQLGAQGVKLHQNILRTDTAALAALSLCSHFFSDGSLSGFL